MDQHQHGVVGFHEVDEDRNPVALPTEGAAEDVVHSGLKLNPFIGVLWLVVGVLVVGGVAFLLNAPLSVSMGDRVSMAYVLFSFAPQGVFVGFSAFLGLMFWHAWQWQRRRG
ncbi:hypothetical protein PY310_18885 [Pseudarthrobacter sp. H3Y2-7]|uniref:hypothetical protein n=1 Tax=Pseudarthrobacter naphthalenicus TaxID=3031328 RepID=UPI0023B04483|nr:hypothetical protein [Pseudarthrobacter sp. H3Y2-7]MDE8670649.1 hypothetical protein [Pseudarthrobacter sp. H3Y2-7]